MSFGELSLHTVHPHYTTLFCAEHKKPVIVADMSRKQIQYVPPMSFGLVMQFTVNDRVLPSIQLDRRHPPNPSIDDLQS